VSKLRIAYEKQGTTLPLELVVAEGSYPAGKELSHVPSKAEIRCGFSGQAYRRIR
jgi:hypothetical protein